MFLKISCCSCIWCSGIYARRSHEPLFSPLPQCLDHKTNPGGCVQHFAAPAASFTCQICSFMKGKSICNLHYLNCKSTIVRFGVTVQMAKISVSFSGVEPLSVSFIFRGTGSLTIALLKASHFHSDGIVLSYPQCKTAYAALFRCCIGKWPRDRRRLQEAPAWALWTGAHVCCCHDIPGLWHRHPVWLPQRLPPSRGLREVPRCRGKRGTEGRFTAQSAQPWACFRYRHKPLPQASRGLGMEKRAYA